MLWLARHGETAYNAVRRFQGQSAVGLNDRGREQARALAEAAAGHDFAALWCSPLARARETGEIVAARIGLELVFDERLMETDAGDWTDRMFDDVAAEDPDRFAQFIAGDPGFAFPGGESFLEQQDRVVAALEEIQAAGPLPALVVCHRNSMRLALERLRGASLTLDDVPNGTMVAL
ncbi:MAG TPA: histidine phosphatase family protein [Solirubrobacteraceae bacterium]|nr:histidine phosphatase family protein [Solirubrobacteraceae bacterium]